MLRDLAASEAERRQRASAVIKEAERRKRAGIPLPEMPDLEYDEVDQVADAGNQILNPAHAPDARPLLLEVDSNSVSSALHETTPDPVSPVPPKGDSHVDPGGIPSGRTEPVAISADRKDPPASGAWLPSRRWYVALAASILLVAAGLASYLAWDSGSVKKIPGQVQSARRIEPIEEPSPHSGSDAPPMQDRAVVITLPAIPSEVFGAVGRARLVAVEFAPGESPRVRPHDDSACRWVLPDNPTRPDGEPFIRPNSGSKWVVILVTDRPAAQTLRALIASGTDFGRGDGPAASAEAAKAILVANGYIVLAYGDHTLNPVSR